MIDQNQLAALQKEVDAFNAIFKPGDQVNLCNDVGHAYQVTVVRPASLLDNHTAVGWFKKNGSCSCFRLDKVRQ